MKNRLVPGGDLNYDVPILDAVGFQSPQKEIKIQLPPPNVKTTPTIKDYSAALNRLNSNNLASSQDNSPTRDSSNGPPKTFINISPKTIHITD